MWRIWASRAWSVADLDARQVASRLTLLLLVLYGERVWSLRIPTVLLAGAGLVYLPLSASRPYWLLLSFLQARVVIPDAHVVDNHKLLMFYWSLSLGFAVNDRSALARNGRQLIAACFCLAAFWKIASRDFTDGSFLHYTFLTDGRFATAARLLGGISPEALASNQRALQQVARGAGDALLRDTPRLEWISLLSTYWVIITELAIGVFFLIAPVTRWAHRWRNLLLLHFVVLTYPVATVIGFGWLLVIMGYSQTETNERSARLLYIGAFLLLQLFLIPWHEILLPPVS